MTRKEMVADFVEDRIGMLQTMSAPAKSQLAVLRRGAGKPMDRSPETWAAVLDGLPEELAGRDFSDRYEPSPAENAVHMALTLFAVHTQGRESDPYVPELSFARSCRLLAETSGINLISVKHRMDAMITSVDLSELSMHARGLVQIMGRNGFGFDYPRFAADLYSYQFPEGYLRTMLGWAREFYTMQGARA